MRPIVLGICLLAAACSGQAVESPSGPSGESAAAAASNTTAPLLFKGSFTFTSSAVASFPTLTITGTAEGTATELGRFTATTLELVDIPTASGTGTYVFTAANGDLLAANVVGGEVSFTPPNVSTVEMTGTIVGGTGRFAGATGTLTLTHTGAIDFASNASSGSGSFEGQIIRKH